MESPLKTSVTNTKPSFLSVSQTRQYGWSVLCFALLLLTFLTALQVMIAAFKILGRDTLEQVVIATYNPFVGLFIGLLATAVVQSSSTVTTTVVVLVASGTVALENAVFMVMGANIGTTVTSTMVAMGHVTRKKEFRKAIAAATLHDFFNIFTTLILLPLEYYFRLLSRLATFITTQITFNPTQSAYINPIHTFITGGTDWLVHQMSGYVGLVLFLAFVLIFTSLRLIGWLFKRMLDVKNSAFLSDRMFATPAHALGFGALITAVFQSSSLTSSLIVPLVAHNRLPLRKAFPFIMGVNVGTTITALIAATSAFSEAFSIALTHLLFNLIGVLILFPIPAIRNLPIRLARELGKATLRSRFVGFSYILALFFLLPFLLIAFNKNNITVKEHIYTEDSHQLAQLSSAVQFIYPKAMLEAQKLLYRQQIYVPKEWALDNTLFQDVLYSHRESDTLYINNIPLYLTQDGSCMGYEDTQRQYEYCVESVQYNFVLRPDLKFDTCFIVRRRMLEAPYHTQRIFIAPTQRWILRWELYNRDERLLGFKELATIR
jgi:sodium-dependent phosphate cotransporter